MRTVTIGNQMIWYDETLLTAPVEDCFDADYWVENKLVVGSAQGRGTTWFVRLSKSNSMEGALRHYRRGGLFGKLVKDIYWFTNWNATRSFQEYQLLNQLVESEVHVPRPVAARAVRKLFWYQADLLSEKIPNAQDLVTVLQTKTLSSEICLKIGVEIRKMHQAQVNHTDLNIHNILLDNDDKVWIIDFDKCSVLKGDAWKKGNLERLKRSFRKEINRRNIHWSEDEWQTLLIGYHQPEFI
ncbi:3-deoxy-D-manno-octulosonic acid kinase [Vibrio crassostreae]|uniref:3-deoxy-D-manno-octulosonic acid kinase n=1 Tax=Vibrio crassostreae TaxID=246167 RepID=UPI001046269E|nr:3-deoxy-D-manno-octulosonic acid kinase [Vibrio crassostreae]TCN84380.1 3-deoxy-D-manno-octulosonic acid kinase [Vibrio crassostreae]TCN92829.1 3-deoxy-D-manno-octulosonic acid kinase [Vibrio crassostreae]CAK1934562.1 3-deoxy-D-manno-octulosonic acid kinase [Vibrio crassostreae]CAK1942912.1 3-deoxy-D-manno-octulosonic acid kinase [Vibrio crassostreae]CAK1948226.1 3-deoxy-D-manno-octulosonic acid kinase [Vibrio crassostreae]